MKLVQKINLAVLGLLLLSALFVGSFFVGSYRDLREETYRWFDKSAHNLAVTIGNEAREAISYFDYEALERALEKHTSEDPNLLYVEIAFDKDLSDVRTAGKPGESSFRPYEVEIKDEDASVLRVTLHYSMAVLEKKLGALVWRLGFGSFVTLAVLLLLLYVLTTRLVTRPLNRIVEYAGITADGDLTSSISIDTTDEFGTLAATLNRMSENLRTMIGKVLSAFGNLEKVSSDITDVSHLIAEGSAGQTSAVDTVSSSIEEMDSSIKSVVQSVEKLYSLAVESSSSMLEMSASVEQVTSNAEGLSSSVETNTSRLDKMTASIRTVADNNEHLAELVAGAASAISEIEATVGEIERNSDESYELSRQAAQTMTEKGLEALGRTADGMHSIRKSVGNAAEVVRILESRSHEIGTILKVINEVNDQTNLLALNAAIISAQAGDHGRGFAVVADEIRELSSRTTSSTAEIKKIIASVQEESRNAVNAMEDGMKWVEGGVKVVGELGTVLRQATENSEKASAASRGIAHATKEQFKGIRHIAATANTITEMAQQMALATRDQSGDTTEIAKSAGQMLELAQQTKRSTAEQARGIRHTSKASEESAQLSQRVLEASREEAKGSELVMHSIIAIQDVTKKNEETVKRLDHMVNILAEQSRLLKQEIGRFKIDRTT